MKQSIAFILSFLVLSSLLYSQDEFIDDLTFEEEFAPDELDVPYFGIGVGYVGSLYFTDFDALNQKAAEFGFSSDALSGPVYLNGIEAFSSIPALKNVKLGFVYKAGEVRAGYSGQYPVGAGEPIGEADFSVSYRIGYGGFRLSYCFTPASKFAVNPRIGFGEGSIKYTVAQNAGDILWQDFLPGNNGNHYEMSIESGYMYLRPGIDFEYAITPWLLVKAGADYNLTLPNLSLLRSSDVLLNDKATVKNVPDNLESNGYQFEVGLCIGLFNIK